jgi:Kdo2-lipid IVA lauroyltransferase/acyltransferase
MSAAGPPFTQRAEAALAGALIRLLSLLPPVTASRLGGAVTRSIGPWLPVSKKVGDANLRLAMPELSARERKRIIRQVWENLGQTITELVRLKDIREVPQDAPGPGYSIKGWDENVAPHVSPGKPMLFFTGHVGNWEIMPLMADAYGVDFGFMYRAPSNKLVDEMLMRLRLGNYRHKVAMFPKGAAGARAAYGHLRQGGALGLLVDQKLDTGVAVPFFGKTAMTMDALASSALKFRCPVFPIHVRRLGPARLEVVCDPALPLPGTGDRQADALALTNEMNRTLERWIREKPGDWLWLHRRWPKDTV